jgi:hypothetical protein
MNYTIELSDEQYAVLKEAVAARPSGTIAELIQEWINELAFQMRPPEHYYTDEEFAQHLAEAAQDDADAR